MISYLSSSFMYAKVANAILFFYADAIYGLLFVIVFIRKWDDLDLFGLFLALVVAIFFPEPTYTGPENITYFRGAAGLEDELNRDKKVIWLVAFYTMWSPACNNLAPIFAHLSAE